MYSWSAKMLDKHRAEFDFDDDATAIEIVALLTELNIIFVNWEKTLTNLVANAEYINRSEFISSLNACSELSKMIISDG